VFRIYKIRTMTHDCERLSGVRWATAHDSRITRVGWFLRQTHLDELPQLWNVLKGEMSLVGPRPERPEFTPTLQKAIAEYGRRLEVRPGLSGLAQVQLPADTDLNSVRLKLAYDLYYIDHLSLWLDSKLIVSTVLKILHFPRLVSVRWLRIPSGVIVESNGPVDVIDPSDSPAHSQPPASCLQPEVV
jgi:lipopolysaccharide/colanic/teichoic acid biosynthesis glycosyltransferase